MRAGRILFDVTYTRLQGRAVGITRTVTRLAHEIRQVARAEGISFACVAFDGRGFREVPEPTPAAAADRRQPALFALVTGAMKPVVEQVLRLPWSVIRPLWAAMSAFSFGQAVRPCPQVTFAAGDVLLLFDAGWNYPVDRVMATSRDAGAAVVTMIYDLMPLQSPQFCVPWVRSAFADWLARAVRGSDAIVCDSRFTLESAREIARQRGWELPPAAHFRLGCDVPTASAGAVRPALREFLSDGRAYASIGSFEPKKNHGLLVAAFEELWRGGCDARLLVVGRTTAECRDVVAQLAHHARTSGRVMIIEDATDAEVACVYGECRAIILPSLFEGFGLPLVEARTRGCPVFASDLPAFREIADAGVQWFDPRRPGELVRLIAADAAGDLALSRAPMPPFEWRDSARQCLERVDALLASAAHARGRVSAPGVSLSRSPEP